MDKLKHYIKNEAKEFTIAIIVLILVVIAFTAYLKFIGLPMTRAKNKYNEAMINLNLGDKIRAKQLLEESLGYWETSEAKNELNNISN